MLSSEIKNALQKTKLNEHLETLELDVLIAHSKIVTFLPGDVILQQGKRNDSLYIILEGNAVVTAKRLGKGEIKILTLQQGNILGEISSIDRGPSHASVTASSDLQCLLITKSYTETLSLLFPATKYKITQMVSREICHRLTNVHNNITRYMAEADMAKRSLFGEVIKSLTKPETIHFTDAEIDADQLRHSPFFALFNNDEYAALLKHSSLLKAPKQCTLIHEGEKNSPYYIILFGAVQSSIVHNNKIAKISVQGPMNLICSISAIDTNLPSIINYTTCERAILLKITESDIDNIKNDCVQLWYKLFDLTCESFATLERSTEKLDIRLNSELYNR